MRRRLLIQRRLLRRVSDFLRHKCASRFPGCYDYTGRKEAASCLMCAPDFMRRTGNDIVKGTQSADIYHTECRESKQCAPAKHHFDECVERVTNAKGPQDLKLPGEDCVEECKPFPYITGYV